MISGLLLLGLRFHCEAQGLSSLRSALLVRTSDTLQIDTLSLLPGSVKIFDVHENPLDTSCFNVDWASGRVAFHPTSSCTSDTIIIRYRVWSFLLTESKGHKDANRLLAKGEAAPNPFLYVPEKDATLSLFQDKGLMANGSLSRGISFGNNQDVFVNSSLNLQLAGTLNDDVEILAAITDENIPIQPEGNTQQLQEFDKVFIQVSKDQSKLIAGDFELRRPDSYFMNFFKRGQGALASTSFLLSDTSNGKKIRKMNTAASVAISKGRFNRLTIQGVEGNQGPYRLSGNAGESFIIVLSGTEKVYIDGQLMTRGMQNDYVIDYNTAEVTFMPKRLITKDSRIIVEYEYSDRNYVRSFYYLNDELETDRIKLKFNFYSEQDSKNQPLLQELDSAQRSIMAGVGDSLQDAIFPTSDSLSNFDDTRVLYVRQDTITASGSYTDIFVYSTDPATARWQVTFSDVGTGQGDYVQDISSANGRVFKWIAPVNGLSQGNYAPVQLLVTPKQRRMLTVGGDVRINQRKSLSFETAWSDNNINLFSSLDKSNDHGIGIRLNYLQSNPLSDDTINGWMLNSRIDYEYAGKNFKAIEPYRPAEFVRDWNVTGVTTTDNENIVSGQVAVVQRSTGTLGYQLKTYQRGSDYSGWNNGIYADLSRHKFILKGSGSLLNTNSTINSTSFLRHNFDLSRTMGKMTLGVRDNAENNQYRLPGSDTLSTGSYAWQEWSSYLAYRDSSRRQATITAKHRKDLGLKYGDLQSAATARELAASAEFGKNPNNTFRNTTTYRDLRIIDSSLITTPSQQTLVNRMDHQLNVWKGSLTAVTYYEVSSGRDRKQEFYYLEVAAGQGAYAYIGDLNGNNVKDLNEFAIANFPDQAKYIRVYFNSDEYVATRSNSFSEVLNFLPGAASVKKKFYHRFSDQFLLRLDKKTTGENVLSSLNPFSRNLQDTILVSTNSSYRNTLFFNRSDPKFGADYTWLQNKNKALLISGFDYRQLTGHTITVRWNMNREWQITMTGEQQDQLNSSQFFSDRNYHLVSKTTEPKLTYQPNNAFRIIGGYKYGTTVNTEGSEETVKQQRFSLESRLNTVNSGSMSARFNYIRLDYKGNTNSFIAYELLGGLTPGTNYTWTLSLLKNLNNLIQVNLNYEGRKGESARAIHTGNVQFRAFF